MLQNAFVSAGTLKARALIGLHLLAAEGEDGSSGRQSPDLGDMWRYGCPESPEEPMSHGLQTKALLLLSSRVKDFSLPEILGTWKGGLELPHRPGHVVPGNA